MPELLKNFRGTIDWSDLSKTVQKCADEAMNKREWKLFILSPAQRAQKRQFFLTPLPHVEGKRVCSGPMTDLNFASAWVARVV